MAHGGYPGVLFQGCLFICFPPISTNQASGVMAWWSLGPLPTYQESRNGVGEGSSREERNGGALNSRRPSPRPGLSPRFLQSASPPSAATSTIHPPCTVPRRLAHCHALLSPQQSDLLSARRHPFPKRSPATAQRPKPTEKLLPPSLASRAPKASRGGDTKPAADLQQLTRWLPLRRNGRARGLLSASFPRTAPHSPPQKKSSVSWSRGRGG